MIALAPYWLLGAVIFVEQPLPGLEVGSRVFPAAVAMANTGPADLDGDGLKDLILPSGIWFQKNGGFPTTGQMPLPRQSASSVFRMEGGRLFEYSRGRLSCHSLLAGRWQLDWEAALALDPALQPADTPVFQDVDGDGRAELIVALKDYLRVFRLSADAPALGDLSVFPPPRPQLPPADNLWASMPRPAAGASATRDFRIVFENGALLTREALLVGDARIEHRFARYAIQQTPEGVFTAVSLEETNSAALPEIMAPCRVVREGPVAFAGARASGPGAFRLGATVLEVLLAPRADAPVQSLRTKSALPFLALADFDGDGDADLLTQSNTLDSGPPREVLMGLASARTIRHSFFVHVQDADNHFDPRPRQALTIDMDLGGPALEGGPRWQAYRQGLLTCSSADFTGDGRADIAAWTGPNRIGIWLNHEGVFEVSPDLVLVSAPGAGFVPADVDADGRADLVILPRHGAQSAPMVYFSR
jgi:hypothetical protein